MTRLELTAGLTDDGAKLEHFLRGRGISLSLIRSLKYQQQGLEVNGARARSNLRLAAGDVVGLTMPGEEGYSVRPEDGPLRILYESADAMVIDKPAGQVVHPSASHHTGTLANLWCGLMERRGRGGTFRPMGRLDGDTSGLVLCAMHPAAAPRLGRTVRKAYLALAGGCMPLGRGMVSAALGPKAGSAVHQRVAEGGKASETAYEVLAAAPELSLVAVWPRSGRTHQIRVHFAALGHPLLGDALYGGATEKLARHGLHCALLGFPQDLYTPRGAQAAPWVQLESPLPPDMAGALTGAGVCMEFPWVYECLREGLFVSQE